MSTSLLKRLAARLLLAEEELVQIAGNGEEFLKLWTKSEIPVLCERGGKSF